MANKKRFLTQKPISKLVGDIRGLAETFRHDSDGANFKEMPPDIQQILQITLPLIAEALVMTCEDITQRPRLTRDEFTGALAKAEKAACKKYEKEIPVAQQFQDNIATNVTDAGVKEAFAKDFGTVSSELIAVFDDIVAAQGRRR